MREYDHKYQELPARGPEKGLNKMAVDIAKSLFRTMRTMAAEGIKLDSGLFDTLLSAYVRQAEGALRQYAADSEINGLNFDRHEEEVAATTFVKAFASRRSRFSKTRSALQSFQTGTGCDPRCRTFSEN